MKIVLFSLGILVVLGVLSWIVDIYNKARLYTQLKPRLDEVERREESLKQEQADWKKKLQEEREAIEVLAREKSKGFPWLASAYADYYYLEDLKKARYLETKKRPARKAAETVREVAADRRRAEKLWRVFKYQLEYYEALFPWLVDFKGEDLDDLVRQLVGKEYKVSEYEERDPVSKWLTSAEYNSLTSIERNQLALDRYWKKKKSKWEIGRDFERFIGYQYESKGWKVYYQGIVEGFADLGRDIIAVRGDFVYIVQCKYWSRYKTIHEKHIFQLYGTVIAYQIDNPEKEVMGVFITSTRLSDRAKLFAKALGIKYMEGVSLEEYPCIKCNISKKTGEKIYHLPFDQQYDKTVVEVEKNECYVATVQEAEALGFRRAFKWSGNK